MKPRSSTVDARSLWTTPWPAICRLARWLGAKVEDGVETPERRAKAVAWCERRMLALLRGECQAPPSSPAKRRTE